MISDSDAMKLAAAIAEMTGQDLSDAGARLFAASLSTEMTLNDMLRMLALWNTRHHDWHRVEAGDLNELWRMQKPASRLTENQINSLLIEQGLEGDSLWAGGAPAMVRRLVNRQVPLARAVEQAAERYRGRELEPPPKRARHPTGRHFIATMSKTRLEDVLTGEHDKHEQ
jgi:hypothetical protein